MRLELLQYLIPREFSLFELSGSSLKVPLIRLSLSDLTWNSHSGKSLSPRGTGWEPLRIINFAATGGNRYQFGQTTGEPKRLKWRAREWAFLGALKGPRYSWKYKNACTCVGRTNAHSLIQAQERPEKALRSDLWLTLRFCASGKWKLSQCYQRPSWVLKACSNMQKKSPTRKHGSLIGS